MKKVKHAVEYRCSASSNKYERMERQVWAHGMTSMSTWNEKCIVRKTEWPGEVFTLPLLFRADSERTEGKQNGYFSAFSPQYFSEDFSELVRAFLAGPLSPTDFSDGLPMD